MKRVIIYIFFILLISCQRDELKKPVTADGSNSLEISFNAPGVMLTKAGTATAADGDKINNIRVWLVDETNTIVGFASSLGANPELKINTGGGNTDPSLECTTDSVTGIMHSLSVGMYTLYALGNAPSSVGVNWDNYTLGTTINNAFLQATATLAAEQLSPSFSEEAGMPLSLVKDVTIKSGTNKVSGELIRLCARLKVIISNNTPEKKEEEDLIITRITFDPKNADRSYIFPKGASVPSYSTREFESYYYDENEEYIVIPNSHSEVLYDSYIFETGSSLGSLNMHIEGGILPVTDTPEFGYVDRIIPTAINPADVENGKKYVIKSYVRNFLLYADGDEFVEGEIRNTPEDFAAQENFPSFIWQIENKSGNDFRIKNIATNKYLVIPTSNSTGDITLGSATTITTNGNNVLYRKSGIRYYQVHNNNGALRMTRHNPIQTSDPYKWLFYPVEYSTHKVLMNHSEEIYHDIPIKYTDQYSVEHPLTSIMRNTVVEIHINVYYSPEVRDFVFEIENWTNHDYETTFD